MFAGCGRTTEEIISADNGGDRSMQDHEDKNEDTIILTDEITELESGLSAVKHIGDYGFDDFLSQGGASSDAQVVSFLKESGLADFGSLIFGGNPFGCSTLSVKNTDGDSLFGRNFDWNSCNAMIRNR